MYTSLYIVLLYSFNISTLLSDLLVTIVLFVKSHTTKCLPEYRQTFPFLLP